MQTQIKDSPTKAALLMLVGCFFFVAVASLVKLATTEASSMQAAFYRSVFSLIPLACVMRFQSISLGSFRWPLLVARGMIGFVALSLYLWAITQIHLADVLSLQQLSPIFVALLSILFLKEKPKLVHYALTGICLLGALLIIRPIGGAISLGSIAALSCSIVSSGAYVMVRVLSRTEPSLRIVAWFSLVAAIGSMPWMLFDWRPLSLRAHLLLIGSGLLAAIAQMLMTASYKRAQAHFASAFSYASVPIAYLSGLLFWEEQPDSISLIGIVCIVGGGVALVLSARKNQYLVQRQGITKKFE